MQAIHSRDGLTPHALLAHAIRRDLPRSAVRNTGYVFELTQQ